MVAAAHDERDTGADRGAAHRARMRQGHRGGQGLRSGQGQTARAHGLVAHARAAGQQRSVSEEGYPAVGHDGLAQGAVVLQRRDVGEQPLGALAGQIKGGTDLTGQVAVEDPRGLMPLDGAAAGRQRDPCADLDHPCRGVGLALLGLLGWPQGDAGALKDLLAGCGDGQVRALESGVQLAGKEIGQGDPAIGGGEQLVLAEQRQAWQARGHEDADLGGRGVGVGLDAVDVQGPPLRVE